MWKTGLTVAFVRYGPNFPERGVYFKLIWDGEEYEFETAFESGYAKTKEAYPDLSISERMEKQYDLNECNFSIGLIPGIDLQEIMASVPEFPQAFVEAWQKAAAEEVKFRRLSVYFKPFSKTSDGEWRVEGVADDDEW